ncbi:hypothetical protein GmHk_02G004694 [Glycine max]|nr:hypothetical protein GmHk_02G004694 [Glycine max]
MVRNSILANPPNRLVKFLLKSHQTLIRREKYRERLYFKRYAFVIDDDVDGNNLQELGTKRKVNGFSSEHQHQEMKDSSLKLLETSPTMDPYFVETCMKLLNSMDNVSPKIYKNVLEKFTNKDWRTMFTKMPSYRRNN